MSEKEINNKNKTDKIDTDKKEETVPNSVIIYIKTRIPNFYKLNYEPYMSVPKNKNHTVYFDPLIKYYETPIKNIPANASKDAVLTQFFNAPEFDTMINRILSDFRYMQKPRTLKDAYNENIINNNMDITLHTLFKPNNLFYINKKPFTIVSSKWNSDDWQINKKPIEQLLNQFPHLTPSQIEKEATNEEDDIPEILRQGNLASSNLSNDEITKTVAAGLQKISETKQDKTVITEQSSSFIPQDKLPGVSQDMKRLYSEYLKQNIPINYSDIPEITRDPLTLSLLINPEELLDFINTNKKSSIIELYSAYMSSKNNLQNADKEYTDVCTELAIYKTTFDSEVNHIIDTISKGPISKEKEREENNKIIQEISLLKINYMKLLFKIADAIMQIYTLQTTYFVSSKLLLEGLKNDYINIIKYYEKPELAIKCIEFDISVLNSLIELDPEDHYSQSYFYNLNNFKTFYEKTLYKNEDKLLNPQVNYKDDEYYIHNPRILMIEKQQYEIYNFKMFLFYSYNQFDIWVSLFKSLQNFTRFIGNETLQILELTELDNNKYNNAFPEEEQLNFLSRINADGISSTFDKTTKRINWYLVKEDGSKCIQPITNGKKPFKLMEDEMKERLYISSIKSQVNAYDAIILYIYLLEINCLRQNKVYVAEENVNQLNLEYSLTLSEYYHTIEENIQDYNSNVSVNPTSNPNELYIPESFLWDTNKLNNMDFIEKRKYTNDKSTLLYRGRIQSIKKSKLELVKNCEEISDIVTPNISKSGFINKCQELLVSNLKDINTHSFKSSYWLEKTIKNYDIKTTSDFLYNINSAVKDAWFDRIIDTREPENYLDWMVYNNSGTNTIDSIYACVSNALNEQLDFTGDDTSNPYTEKHKNINRFTIDSLKRLIADVNSDPNITPNEIINILQDVLKIRFIIFEMFLRKDNSIMLGDIVTFQNRKFRVLDIQTFPENGNITYTLYDGFENLREIPSIDVELSSNNMSTLFRINCDSINISNDYDDYIYLVASQKKSETFLKYRLVKNSNENQVIYNFDSIPTYINYLIYNNCIRFNNNYVPGTLKSDNIFIQFTELLTRQIERDTINNELNNIVDELDDKIQQYNLLKENKNKTLEEKTEKTLLKGNIKDLKARKKQIEDTLKYIEEHQDELTGGEIRQNPRQEYSNYYPGYYTPLGYPMNPNMPTNTFYLPQINNRGYSYNKRLPYNISQNKQKDKKSKLSFYITVELELFPGTSANMLQKSAVKCQSSFEKIREAYADIFGFQYRPAPMSESYNYTVKNSNENENENKSNENKNNKTNKNIKYNKNNNKTRKYTNI